MFVVFAVYYKFCLIAYILKPAAQISPIHTIINEMLQFDFIVISIKYYI